MKKQEIKYKSMLFLMCLRCEYISGDELTKKGKGFFSPPQWRFINKIKCMISKKWLAGMLATLDQVAMQSDNFLKHN